MVFAGEKKNFPSIKQTRSALSINMIFLQNTRHNTYKCRHNTIPLKCTYMNICFQKIQAKIDYISLNFKTLPTMCVKTRVMHVPPPPPPIYLST